MRQLQIEDLYFTGAKKIKRRKNQDERGYLSRLFCFEELKRKKISFNIKQINLTLTKKKGTIRGLHYQLPPHSEIKIVTCIKGEIFDVIVDLRKGSPTFLKKYSLKLSQKNMKSLVIPKGFAHGFQALKDNCEILYFHSASYKPAFEDGLNFNDPKLSIKWPLKLEKISKRDKSFKLITSKFEGMKI